MRQSQSPYTRSSVIFVLFHVSLFGLLQPHPLSTDVTDSRPPPSLQIETRVLNLSSEPASASPLEPMLAPPTTTPQTSYSVRVDVLSQPQSLSPGPNDNQKQKVLSSSSTQTQLNTTRQRVDSVAAKIARSCGVAREKAVVLNESAPLSVLQPDTLHVNDNIQSTTPEQGIRLSTFPTSPQPSTVRRLDSVVATRDDFRTSRIFFFLPSDIERRPGQPLRLQDSRFNGLICFSWQLEPKIHPPNLRCNVARNDCRYFSRSFRVLSRLHLSLSISPGDSFDPVPEFVYLFLCHRLRDNATQVHSGSTQIVFAWKAPSFSPPLPFQRCWTS